MRRALIPGALVVVMMSVAAVATTARAGGGNCRQPITEERGTSVELRQNCMAPTVLRVGTNEAVTFTNRDQVAHTVTGAGIGAGQGWGSYDELPEGDSFVMTFDKDGVYPYFCILHPSMIGVVVAGDGSNTDASAAAAIAGGTSTTSNGAGAGRAGVVAASAGGAAAALAVVALAYGAVVGLRRRRAAH
jgi:plastocyanin